MNKTYTLFSAVLTAALFSGCANQQPQQAAPQQPIINNTIPERISFTPQAIPGTPKSENDAPTGGYAPTNVETQFRIDVKDDTKQLKVIRDNTDPFVITKAYKIKQADPYAVRSYLAAVVDAKSVYTSPVQAAAVKFNDGTGLVLVSAEEYRFSDSKDGRGIDNIVAALDRKGLVYKSEAGTRIYFPRISRAANLRDMLIKVGSSELDAQFEISPSTILVDAELNALIIKAPDWAWEDMRSMLAKYDKPIPEVRVSYRVIEIYAENDDRIGVDFQTWKNNEGVDLFSAGTVASRNWGTFFTSGVQPDTGSNKISYWNFNPKWNTRYLDFMTSIGKAKVLAQGQIVAQNRVNSNIQVNSGFFYDRTYYKAGATSIAEGCTEFTYTEPNPDTIQREATTKIMPYSDLMRFYLEAGSKASFVAHPITKEIASTFVPMGYTLRMMNTQTGTYTYGDASAVNGGTTDPLAKFLTGYVYKDANGNTVSVPATYYNTNKDQMYAAPGIIHGWLQYPMVTDGFSFNLNVLPVVTGKAAKLTFDLNSVSLLGWNSDGSARTSKSNTATTFQIGTGEQEFVIGGLRKSESVRGTSGLPFFKDVPVLGRLLSTESESIKQSQLVVVAKVTYVNPDDFAGAEIRDELGKIVKGVNKGMNSRVGNMFFQQYLLDEDRVNRIDRLDKVGNIINDEYKVEK